MVDASFLNLTPATRTGVIHDEALEAFVAAMAPLEARLAGLIEERKRAEDEQNSRDTLRAIQRAFREAMLALPAEEYDWFEVNARKKATAPGEAQRAGHEAADGIAVALRGEDLLDRLIELSLYTEEHCAEAAPRRGFDSPPSGAPRGAPRGLPCRRTRLLRARA